MRKFINGKWTELTPVKPQAPVVNENQQEQEPEQEVKKPKAPVKKKSVLDVFKKKKS